jgi:formylglycine-generating enzyme required for sulfatase activity
MSLTKKPHLVFTIVLVIAVGAGCCSFTPKTTAPHTKVKTHRFNGIEFVWIPPGTFDMGSPDAQPGRGADEGPVHAVTIDQGFWISRREISQKEYALVMNERPSAVQRDEMPVTNVSWLDAMAFCAKLSADSGAAYSLPSEAQWEYAARAGGSGAYHFGNDPILLDIYDWYAVNAPNKEVQYGGQRAPNRWGVYDVHGNLSEWCYDVYREDAYTRCSASACEAQAEAVARVVRGGSVKSKADECRVAARAQAAPEAKSPTLGFRIVRDKLPTSSKFYRSAGAKN